MTYINHCEGCKFHLPGPHNNNSPCIRVKFNGDGECPCTTCVVKMMCLLACPEFKQFRENHHMDRCSCIKCEKSRVPHKGLL